MLEDVTIKREKKLYISIFFLNILWIGEKIGEEKKKVFYIFYSQVAMLLAYFYICQRYRRVHWCTSWVQLYRWEILLIDSDL